MRKRFKETEIINLLRGIEVMVAEGLTGCGYASINNDNESTIPVRVIGSS